MCIGEIMSKVVVGLSGGVDSSVAAYLLKKQGHEVIGVNVVTLAGADISDARKVAGALDIPFETIDLSETFSTEVIDYFANEYKNGRTPNPCIRCNRFVKWEGLLAALQKFSADYVATGHYAHPERLENGRYTLGKADSKDQTYALFRLSQEQLSKTLMPLAGMNKDKVREIAREAGIPIADKPDSQEICFIPDHDYVKFLREKCGISARPGNFIDENGNVIGKHNGITNYTIGQRKGLGAFGHPVFVKEIRPLTNEVVLGEGGDVFASAAFAEDINYVGMADFEDGYEAVAKIRYSHAGSKCRLFHTENGIKACFFEPVRAVTPGQALVIYDDKDRLVAGGTIVLPE